MTFELFKEELEKDLGPFKNTPTRVDFFLCCITPEIKKLIEDSESYTAFKKNLAVDPELKFSQFAGELLLENDLDFVRSFLKEPRETYSDVGCLKIGTKDFQVKINNGYGDGEMYYSILKKEDMFNHHAFYYRCSLKVSENTFIYSILKRP